MMIASPYATINTARGVLFRRARGRSMGLSQNPIGRAPCSQQFGQAPAAFLESWGTVLFSALNRRGASLHLFVSLAVNATVTAVQQALRVLI
jgi:hypothetical protein